ncbi:hypothetical protein R1flu_004801 [Riccia fluitans]|uniref:Legume lectin domain-containing protein n=1 Tax=Riccia fluitans TaxID=41844 RepID=A0ABD1YVB3_9MARC
MILAVLMTILSLLAFSADQAKAQGPVDFNFPVFDTPASLSLTVLNNASVDTFHEELKVSDPSESWCNSNYCQGQIYYATPIDIIEPTMQSTYSFSTSFVFSLTSPASKGEGLVFMLTGDPYANQGSGVGTYFGLFPGTGQSSTPTIAVEFDTLKNNQIFDLTDNHVGVDINTAVSVSQERVYGRLNDGEKFQTWIDYHDSTKRLEVRLTFWSSSVTPPAIPVIDIDFNLTAFADDKMYAGFSANTYTGQQQEAAIYSWMFRSTLENSAPPPPLPSNASVFPAPFKPVGNHSRNHTLSKEEKIVLGFCIGGGLGVIVVLGGCFWLGYHCGRKRVVAAGEGSVASGSTGDAGEADDRTEKFDEQLKNAEQGTLIPVSTRGSSLETTPGENESTSTELREESPKEFVRTKSAREIQAEGVKADAIKRGILNIEEVTGSAHAPFRRRITSFHDLGSAGDAPEVEAQEIVYELPVNDLKEENESVSDNGETPDYSRGEHGEIVYEITAKPDIPAEKSKSWSIWSSKASSSPLGDRRHTPPSGPVSPRTSVKIKRKRFWSPWSSVEAREVDVVLKSAVPSSSTDHSERSHLKNPEVASPVSPPAETIMFSNALYDSPPEESREPSQCSNELHMEDEVYVPPSPQEVFDSPSVAGDSDQEELVERIFDVGVPNQDEDVEQVFDVPVSQTSSRIDAAVDVPFPSRRGSRKPSQAGTRAPSPLGTPSASPTISPAGTATSSPTATSGSSSSKDSESKKTKRKPRWRY